MRQILLLFVMFLWVSRSSAGDGDEVKDHTRVLSALRASSEIRIDGSLDEPQWHEAEPATDFRQYQPAEGEPATEPTEVRILYDEASLYVGVWCYDSEPGNIVAQKLQRDDGLDEDDSFRMILDTFHDHRNGYYFATNPNGVQEDGQVQDGDHNADRNWDGVWEVKARIHDRGWSAEIRIPFWTLRFRNDAQLTWGINFQRVIRRKNEEVNWTSWHRNDNERFFRVSTAGELAGLSGIESPTNLQFKPYALGKSTRDFTQRPALGEELGDVGFDVKYGLTPSLTLDLTYNTDFAQVEADVQQVNLTRFSLFFPEKREFFLEKAGTFQFGTSGFEGQDMVLFFSRRIGLENGRAVPILGGGQVTGKVGAFTVGALDIATQSVDGIPRSHFSVLRVKRDVFERSKIGAIVTNRNDKGVGENRTFGLDGNFWLTDRFKIDGFYALNMTPGSGRRQSTAMVLLDYTADLFGWTAEHLRIEDGFDPRIGFVPRDNMRRDFLAVRFSRQPNGRLLRRVDWRNSANIITDLGGRLQDRDLSTTIEGNLDSGDQVHLSLSRSFRRLDRAFTLRQELPIPAGDYETNELSTEFQTSSKRPWTAQVGLRYGGFYSGTRRSMEFQLGYVLSPNLSFDTNYERNSIDIPAGRLTTDLTTLRVNVLFSTKLYVNALFQYNSDSEQLSSNVRLKFRYSPGSDLYLVLNENRDTSVPGYDTRDRAVAVKMTKLFHL